MQCVCFIYSLQSSVFPYSPYVLTSVCVLLPDDTDLYIYSFAQ